MGSLISPNNPINFVGLLTSAHWPVVTPCNNYVAYSLTGDAFGPL